ncbi:MAG: DUF5686 and carboxypeptidase regulatory-like domain-containing protein [Ginsengibacter sp.]
MQKLLLVLFLLPAISLSAQKIEGTVKDEEGNILPFATILVKGTSMGVTANNQGQYSISLSPGNYTLDCRYVGYTSSEKNVSLSKGVTVGNFILSIQKLILKEITVATNGEDPAYEIIRQAIKKRSFYEEQVDAFTVEAYVKGIIKLRELPKKIFGKKIPETDRNEMGVDSSGKGIIYLSESVSKVSSQKPDKFKLEVVSSRVSGSNGLGFDFPIFISLYKNNVMFAPQMNPRGFVSPIADGALGFYKYKFMGSFFEDGQQVNVIKVIPRRNYEPLFSGIINITENDWRIYSCDLLLTKQSQLQIIDSLNISQIHMPVSNEVWRVKNQVLHFSFDQFGLKAAGDFLNIYSKYNIEPDFKKGFFNRVVIKYDSAVTKKTHEYWDTVRPVPLEPEEIKDYKFKDSLLKVRIDSSYQNLDSLRKRQGNITIGKIFWSGVNQVHYKTVHNNYRIKFDPLLKTLQYNTVEGLAINPSLVISKRSKALRSNVSFIADARYGFNNNHLNPWVGFTFDTNEMFDINKKPKRKRFFVAGGKRVSQFFKDSDIDGLGNSIGTLLYGRNEMKIYENYFGKIGFSRQWESSANLSIEAGYEDRLPIDNTTDFILNKKWLDRFTPNYPVEIMSSQFTRHQSVAIHAGFNFQPGQRYIQYPKYKMAIGSEYPTFLIEYTEGIKDILGSDVDYDKWKLKVTDDMNLKLAGAIKYNVSLGGFLNSSSVYAQDYNHFYGNLSHVSKDYLKSFQNVPYYEFSNTSSFYSELHFEHHANGLLTNKIPLFKKLNWTLVEGVNAVFINPSRKYAEASVGIENILKIFRIDALVSLQPGFKPVYTYRVGLGGLLGDALNIQRFTKNRKIIGVW